MTALEALQSVQFVTVNGQRLAVLHADDWEWVVEWLGTLEDVALTHEAIRRLWGIRWQSRPGWLATLGCHERRD